MENRQIKTVDEQKVIQKSYGVSQRLKEKKYEDFHEPNLIVDLENCSVQP